MDAEPASADRTGHLRTDVRQDVAIQVQRDDDVEGIGLLEREDLGVAVIPSIVVRELENGALLEIAQLPGLTETFYAVTMARRHTNPLLQNLLDTASAAAPRAHTSLQGDERRTRAGSAKVRRT